MAETPRRREPILGKKEHNVVGLFSAWRGDAGGRIGVREEEEREDGSPGVGVRGVVGLEGGNDDGLEFVSSVELRDSLRKWVYLVFGTSSIMNLQSQFFYSCMSTEMLTIFYQSFVYIKSFSQERCPTIGLNSAAQETHPSVWLSLFCSLPGNQNE